MRQLSRHDANFGLLEVVSTARLPVDLEGFQVSRSLLEKWHKYKADGVCLRLCALLSTSAEVSRQRMHGP